MLSKDENVAELYRRGKVRVVEGEEGGANILLCPFPLFFRWPFSTTALATSSDGMR